MHSIKDAHCFRCRKRIDQYNDDWMEIGQRIRFDPFFLLR